MRLVGSKAEGVVNAMRILCFDDGLILIDPSRQFDWVRRLDAHVSWRLPVAESLRSSSQVASSDFTSNE